MLTLLYCKPFSDGANEDNLLILKYFILKIIIQSICEFPRKINTCSSIIKVYAQSYPQFLWKSHKIVVNGKADKLI